MSTSRVLVLVYMVLGGFVAVASTVVRDVYEKILMAGRQVDARRALALNRIVVVAAGMAGVEAYLVHNE